MEFWWYNTSGVGDFMYSLYIDTHYSSVVIVLYKDGKLLYVEQKNELKHSTITMPMIVEVLERSQLKINDVKEIICVNGPGSFTGVRIGVTIAKMLGIALGIKIKVIDYLNLMAFFVNDIDKWVSIVDKNGAFVGHFDENNKALEDYRYYNKSDYMLLSSRHEIVENISVDYNKLYEYVSAFEGIHPHLVNPVYVKNVVV